MTGPYNVVTHAYGGVVRSLPYENELEAFREAKERSTFEHIEKTVVFVNGKKKCTYKDGKKK